ncbi:MAG: hypothetical protein J0H32_08775 [Rhizobiales bacterium]|nr:hypothetical protein [Hyphomicrobiales bacterium]
MHTSIFLARLIGPVMAILGLAVLFNQNGFRDLAREFVQSRALIFLSGLVILPAGIAIILVHNVWTVSGSLMITLFGWITAITSAVRVIAPQFVMTRGSAMLQRPKMPLITGCIWTAAGLLFCLYGYR